MFESLRGTWGWLENLPFAVSVRESAWLFPTIETVHVLALVVVIGSIFTVDLRLLGLTSRNRTFTAVAGEMLPWTWMAFAVAICAGFLLFSSKAVTYAGNLPFRLKMLFLLLAGINMLTFQFLGSRAVTAWDMQTPPASAKLAGGASLLLWAAVVATGRLIGFTT
jgi:hypothetical protein